MLKVPMSAFLCSTVCLLLYHLVVHLDNLFLSSVHLTLEWRVATQVVTCCISWEQGLAKRLGIFSTINLSEVLVLKPSFPFLVP
jgi:hypothetical protein